MSRHNGTGSLRYPATATPSPTQDRTTGAAQEPTPQDLAAIEAEWPLIEAGIALVEAEIGTLKARHRLRELDWRRLRRAQDRVLRTAAALASRTTATALGQVA